MLKITEGTFALGGLAALAIWAFIVQPLLYLPREIHGQEQIAPKASAQNADTEPKGTARAPIFVQVVPAPKTAEGCAQETDEREEKKVAVRRLVMCTAALFSATVGLILATG